MVTLRRWWHDPSLRIPFLIVATVRIFTLVLAFISVRIGGPVFNPYSQDRIFLESMDAVSPKGPLYSLVEPWQRWDTGWYLKVAVHGYAPDDGSIIFAPLYPVTSRIAGLLLGDTLAGGLLVSTVSGLIFLVCLYKLVVFHLKDQSVARYTLYALVAFPTAFYLMAAYTESLYLALTAGTLLAVSHRRWWLSAVLAAAATLTRLQGWVLFFPVGWLAFVEAPRFWEPVLRETGTTWPDKIRRLLPDSIPRLAAMGGGPTMVVVFFVYLAVSKLGDLTTAYDKIWAMQVKAPWAAVIDVIGRITAGRASFTEIAGLAALIFIVIFMLASIGRLPALYHMYMWPTLVLILLRYYPLILLNGTMRYVLDFFPIFITISLLATGLLRRTRSPIALITSAGLLAVGVILQIVLLFLFARWMWIA